MSLNITQCRLSQKAVLKFDIMIKYRLLYFLFQVIYIGWFLYINQDNKIFPRVDGSLAGCIIG